MIRFIRLFFYSFSKEGIEKQRVQLKQEQCKHERWNCDTQIRTIECKNCGIRGWIDDYVDLYKK